MARGGGAEGMDCRGMAVRGGGRGGYGETVDTDGETVDTDRITMNPNQGKKFGERSERHALPHILG